MPDPTPYNQRHAHLFQSNLQKPPTTGEPFTFQRASEVPFGRYDKIFYDTDNEELYAQRQSAAEQLANGAAKMAGTFTTSFLEGTVGVVNGIGQMLSTGKFSSFYDNDLNRKLDDFNKYLEDALPNYYTHAEKDAEWYSPKNIFSANFLGDKVLKNLGYSFGALAGGVGWGALVKSIGLTNRLVRAGQGLRTVEAVETAMVNTPKVQQFGAINNTLNSLWQASKNTAGIALSNTERGIVSSMGMLGEATVEAYQASNEFRNKLIQDYKNLYGTAPKGSDLEEINSYADSVGNNVFGANAVLLTLTNYIQLPKILGSSKTLEKRMINNIEKEAGLPTGKFVAGTPSTGNVLSPIFNKLGKPGRAIDKFVLGPGRLAFSLGEAFEEGAQYAAQVGSEDYFERAYKNKEEVDSFIDGVGGTLGNIFTEGVRRALSDKEGLESILIGGISGGIQTIRGNIRERGLAGTGGIYGNNTALAINALNKTNLKQVLQDGVKYAGIAIESQKLRQGAIANDDTLAEKDYEKDYTLSYIMPRVKYGKVDSVFEEIGYYREQVMSNPSGFQELQGAQVVLPGETKERFLERLTEIEETAKEVNNFHSMLEDKYSAILSKDGKRVYNDEVIDRLTYSAARISDYDKRLAKLSGKLQMSGVEQTSAIVDAVTKSDGFVKGNLKETIADKTVKEIIDSAGISITEKDLLEPDEKIKDVVDLVRMLVNKQSFVNDYTTLKAYPEQYKPIAPPAAPPPPEEEEPITGEKVKIKTATGEKEYEVGQKYFVGKGVDYEKEGLDAPVKVSSLTILSENEDGTLRIRDNKGEERDISKDALQDYKLSKESTLLSNKTAKYFYNHRNEVFVYNFGKAFGGEKPGRLEYDNGKLFFVYLDGKGKIKRKQLDNSHFVAQEGYKNARIKRVGVIETTEQKEAREEFTSAEELAKQKETLAKSKDKRIQIITELETETRTRLEEVNKKLDTKKKELEGIQEELDEISKDVSVASARTKREKKLEEKYPELSRQKVRFSRVLSTTSKALTKLSRMREDVENEISTLNAEKDELEFNLSYIEDFGQNLDELPENSGEFLKELKDQVQWIEMLIDQTGKDINALSSIAKTIEKAIKEFVSLLESSINKFDDKYPEYIKNSFERIKENPVFSEVKGLKEYLADYALLQDLQKEISVNEGQLSDVSDDIDDLYKQLNELGSQYQAKKTILDRFQAVSDAYERRKAEEAKMFADEQLLASALGTADTGVQTAEFNKEFEPSAKKSDEIIWRATMGIVRGNKPHQIRANTFGFNLNRFDNRKNIRGVYVTSKNEDQILPGLTDLLRIDEAGLINEDVKKDEIIALVMVQEDEDGKIQLVGVDGQPIPEGANALDFAIFQVFPDRNLQWGAEFNNQSMFRKETPQEVKDAITKQYREWRSSVLENPDLSERHQIEASFGRAENVTDADGKIIYETRTSVQDANLITEDDLEATQLIRIPTLPTEGNIAVEKQGTVTFRVAVGTPLLETSNGLVKLQNKKHTEKEAETIYQAILQLAKNMLDPQVGIKDPKSERLLNWLKSTVYWGIPEDQNKNRKPAGYNSVFFEKDAQTNRFMLTLSGKGKDFVFTPTALEENKDAIVLMLSNMYNNINNSFAKQLNEPYEEILSISESGEITSRVWKNYQSYLLSSKTPDGKTRSGEELPLSTTMRPAANAEDVNRTNIYFYTTDTADDFVIPVVEKKKAVTPKVLTPGAPTPTKATPQAPTQAPVSDINAAIDKRIIEKELTNGTYSFDVSEEGDQGIVITKENVNEAIKAEKELKDVIYNNKNNTITGIPIPIIEVETSPGTFTEFRNAKELQDFINDSKEDAEERKIAKKKYDELAALETAPAVTPTEAAAPIIYTLDGRTPQTYTSPQGKKVIFIAPATTTSENALTEIKILKGGDLDEVVAKIKAAGKDPGETLKKTIFNAITPTLNEIRAMEAEFVVTIPESVQQVVVADAESKIGRPISQSVLDAVNREISNISDEALRVVIEKELKTFVPENWNRVETWLKANFPNVPVYRVKNIIQATNGRQAWGMFKDGAIYIYENAEVGTVYHEVFHAVWRMFTDSAEQKAILDEMKSRSGKFFDRASLKDVKYSEATEEQLEEKLAEEFRDYVQFKKIPAKPEKGRPYILKLFADMVTAIKEFFLKSDSDSKVAKMFSRIGEGYYKSHIPFQTNLAFAKQGIIDVEDAFADSDAVLSLKNITDKERNDIIQHMTYLTLTDVIRTDESLFNIEKRNKKEVYAKLKDQVLETISLKIRTANKLVEKGTFTQEQVNPLMSSTLQLMQSVEDQWPTIIERHEEYLKSYQIEFDENDNINLRDENNSGRETYQDATKIDNFKKASSAIKLLLATIPEVNDDGKIEPSSIGGAKLLPVGKTYISLMSNLHTSASIEEMLGRLRKMAVSDPNYRALYKRITKRDWKDEGVDLSAVNTQHGLQLISSLWNTFKKQNPDVKNVFILENGEVVVGEANLSSAAQQLRSEYLSSIVFKSKEGKGFFTYDAKEKVFKGDPNKLKGVKLDSITAMVDFLNNMGVSFTVSDVNKMTPEQYKMFRDATLGIKESISKTEKIATFSGKALGMSGRLLELGLVKAAVSNPEFSSTYFNVSGERTQSFIGTNAASDLYEFLSKLERFNNGSVGGTRYSYLLTDSFAKYSNLLSRMFTTNGVRKEGTEDLFKIGYVSGVVNEEKGKRKESSRLTYKDRLIQELNLNLSGYYLNLVPGDASIEWTIKMGNAISTASITRGMDDINAIFKGYFMAELELVRENRVVAKGRKSNEMRFFMGILGDTLHKDVLDAKGTPEEVHKRFENKINEKIADFMQKDMMKLKNSLRQYGVLKEGMLGFEFENINLPKNITEKEVDKQLMALTANYMIANIEMHKLLYSDPYQYEDELKRIKSFNSPRQAIISGSPKMNTAFDRVWNRGYTSGDIGYTKFTRDFFRSATHKDVIGIIDLPNYTDFKETDGSGIISMKANRHFRIRASNWNDAEERQYRYDIAWEKNDKGIELTKEEQEIYNAGNPGIKSAYTPIKPIVSGSKLSKNGTPNSYNDVVLDKFALYPLSYRIMKELDKDANALKLYDKMQKEDIDYVVFTSGRKVGAESPHDTYKENGEFNDTPYKAVINVPFSIMSVQSEVPSKEDNLVTRGSQITKLITLDFMEAGVPVDFFPGQPFPNRYKAWNKLDEAGKLTYKTKDDTEPLYKTIKNNQDLLEALIEEGYKSTLDRLGIKETVGKDGKKKFEITDFSKAVQTLRDEILKREVNDNVSDALAGFLQGKVVLEATPAYQQIRNIIYSIADKQFISPKISGGMKVQIPSTLIESGARKVKDGLYESDVLDFYVKDGKRVAEVMLGRWFDSPLSDEELLKYLNETEEGQRILSGVGYRIPTQKQNSIDAIVIKKFLPKEFGDSVVIPAALVQKVGSDFDIDKLSVYLKNVYIKDGKPQLVQFLTDENSTVEERYVHWVKENSERDTRKYIKFLTRSQVQNLKVNFEIELAKLKAKYQVISVERKEDLFQQMSDDIQSNISKELSPQEEYMDELFNLGKKVFWRMDDITREPFWQVKNDISRKGIKGPDEIRRYLSLTVGMLQDPNTLEDDIVRLEGLEKIYTEELRIMGIMNETVEQVKKDAIAEFRKNKEALKNTLKLEKATEFDSVDNAYEEAKTELGFQSAQEIANIDGLLSIEEFRQLSIFNQNIKKALENAYIQSMENFITHPLNYDNLIKPNSAQPLKDLSIEIAEKTVGQSFDYKNVDNMLDRTFMSRLRHAFVTGKYAIGIAAVNQTNHSLNQRQPIYVDKSRLSRVSDEDRFWLGNADIKFDSYNTIEIDGKMVPTLSMITNKAGESISDIIGMFIDGYVDISKGPWIMELGATPNVASTWLFLIKVGVPVKTVAYFMNQPIIRDYLRNIESAGYSWLFIDTFVKEMSEIYQQDMTEAELNERLATFRIPGETALKNNVGKRPSELSNQEKMNQYLMLLEFLKYAKMAEQMFHVTQGSNYDTSTFNDPYLVFKKQMQQLKAQNTIISSVDTLLTNSFIGKLAETVNSVRDAFAEILKSDSPKVRNVIQKVLIPYVENNDRDFVKIAQKAVNDLFDWAVQVDQKLNDDIKNILINDGGVGREVVAFVNSVKAKGREHPLYDNEVINIIQGIPSVRAAAGGANNVKLNMGENKVYDQNNIIYAFRELRDYLKGENDPLYERIKTLAVLQSGLSSSPISFTSLLPYEDFEDIYNKTLSKLEGMPNLDDFYKLGVFQRNNWNNDDVVPYLKAALITSASGRKHYNPSMKFLPDAVTLAVANNDIPPILTRSKRNREANSDYIVYTWEKQEELLSKEEIDALTIQGGNIYKAIASKKAAMRQAGDYSYINKALFKKVYDNYNKAFEHTAYDGQKYFVYKAINAWGDSFRANEFWATDHKSVLENGFLKVEDVDNNVIISKFLDGSKVKTKATTGGMITADVKSEYPGKPEFNKLPAKSAKPTMTYAGIGSRQTPKEVLVQMTQVAKELQSKGYTLNTGVTFRGNKEGADKAFDDGATKKNLFSPENQGSRTREQAIAREIHPNPRALSQGGLKLMARNTNQVFGDNLNTPVDFVLFYAKETNGIRPEGGTGQAVEMARLKGIPTINMANANWREQLDRVLSTTPVVAPIFSSSFSAERQQEIINNFASKHKITKEAARKNIEEAIASRGQDAINQLKECY